MDEREDEHAEGISSTSLSASRRGPSGARARTGRQRESGEERERERSPSHMVSGVACVVTSESMGLKVLEYKHLVRAAMHAHLYGVGTAAICTLSLPSELVSPEREPAEIK